MLRWTRRRRLAVSGLLCASLALGCAFGRGTRNIDRNPVVDTGVGASIIMPGQSAPAHAPGGSAGAAPTPEGGASQVVPQPKISAIGSSSIDEERNSQYKEEPVWWKYAALPFAVVGAPFKAAAEAVRDEPEGPAPQVPDTRAPRQSVAPEPRPTDFETAQIDAMERELAMRQADSTRAPAPAPRTPSIADELAALQRTPAAPRSTPAPTPAPAPSSGDPQPGTRAAPEAADGIVDRDGDGRIDQWIYRDGGQVVRKEIDQNGDGRPDQTIHYDPRTHRIVRVEEDADHDGATDAWLDYHEGKIVRRRGDVDHDGSIDTWTWYDQGRITRHEQDTTGDGFRDRIGYYDAGLLRREEFDTNGDGRVDVTSHYDEKERVARREEDTDLDGRVDVITHYEEGRLARRELLDAER